MDLPRENWLQNKNHRISIPTINFRDKIKSFLCSQRDKKFKQDVDALRFGLGEIQIKIKELDKLSANDVTILAGRIKRRNHATIEDMYRLSHAFLQDMRNICAFSMIPGSIQVLTKELTGQDYGGKLAAAKCFCNFSLGDIPVSDKIVYFAGSYLITYLDSSDLLLKHCCLWTLTNIASNGGKSAESLIKMGLVSKLWELYFVNIDFSDKDDFHNDGAICLQLLLLQSGQVLLNLSDLKFLVYNLTTMKPNNVGSEYYLQIMFHSGILKMANLINEMQLDFLITFILDTWICTNDFNSNVNRLLVLYFIRILGNLLIIKPKAFYLLQKRLKFYYHTNMAEMLNRLFAFRNVALNYEILWLTKNILMFDKFYELKLISSLCIFNDV